MYMSLNLISLSDQLWRGLAGVGPKDNVQPVHVHSRPAGREWTTEGLIPPYCSARSWTLFEIDLGYRPTESAATVEKPAVERLWRDRPAVDRPWTDRSAVDKPWTDRSAVDKPWTDRSAMDRPWRDRSDAVDRPWTDRSAVDRPRRDRSAMDWPWRDRSAMDRPWRDRSAVDRPEDEAREKFILRFDVGDWKQDEIRVKVKARGGIINISARPQPTDGGNAGIKVRWGARSREDKWRYVLPRDVDEDKIQAFWGSDGILTLEAQLKLPKEKEIPIQLKQTPAEQIEN